MTDKCPAWLEPSSQYARHLYDTSHRHDCERERHGADPIHHCSICGGRWV